MKHIKLFKYSLLQLAAISVLSIVSIIQVNAQGGPSSSISYDVLPYQDFEDPIVLDDGSLIDNAQVRLSRTRATFTYPFVFSKGRTILVNDFSYQLIELEYRNLSYPLERLHSGSYTFMLQHRMSQGWSLWALGTPSIASDLKAEVSEDDFNFQAAAIFIRHFNERFSIGLGAAYSTQFGSAAPLPVLAFDWNNGKNLMAKAIFPISFEFWYRPGQRVDIGILLSGDGNNYHGDPNIYGVPNPELRYTMMTVGVASKIALTKFVKLNIEGGVIGLHRFEFYEGDIENSSFDLKPSQYVKFGIGFGQ